MKLYKDVSFLFRFARVLFTTLVIFFNQESFSSYPFIAEATLVRGKATFLSVPEKKALTLKKGIKIRQGTSIVTGKNSFVRLRFKNGSLISLGSNSKIVVYNVGKKKTGVISLIEGKLRSKIEKKNKVPLDFIRKVNSNNPNANAWAQFEKNQISLEQFDQLFSRESEKLGYRIAGKKIIQLLNCLIDAN